MSKDTPVSATTQETTLGVNVTSAPGSAGVAVAYTTKSSAVTIGNNSLGCDLQYSIDSGAWQDLERGCGINLPLDFSAQALYLRRSTLDGGLATANLVIEGLPVVRVGATTIATHADGEAIALSAGRALTAADDGKVYACTTALTVTIPAGLSPRPNVAFIAPPTGNLSIASSGGALLNGATTTLTRSRASNPAGVALVAYVEADGYGVSGS